MVMNDLIIGLRKYWLDAVFIGLPAAGAIACWVYRLPAWMLAICLLAVFVALVSLLGDLGVFGGDSQD